VEEFIVEEQCDQALFAPLPRYKTLGYIYMLCFDDDDDRDGDKNAKIKR
jgi:hypothetical protein